MTSHSDWVIFAPIFGAVQGGGKSCVDAIGSEGVYGAERVCPAVSNPLPLLQFYAIGAKIFTEIKNWYGSQVFILFIFPNTIRLAGWNTKKISSRNMRLP